MYSIPAPIIKKLLDYCDLPTAIIMARVTKRCNKIFNQYREEILERGEYVNIPNMFKHCSDEFIITMSRHKFFDNISARDCCYKMRHHLVKNLNCGEVKWYYIDKKLLQEIYEKNEYEIIDIGYNDHKLVAATVGIDLDIPYPNNRYGLKAALLLKNEKMINMLRRYGNFYIYCTTSYYNLADNYDIFGPIQCINDSNDPLSAFNYIEKRGYKFKERDYFEIENYEILKLVMPRITKIKDYYVATKDFNALKLIYDALIKITSIDKFFNIIIDKNSDFTRYIMQKHEHLKNKIELRDLHNVSLIELVDLVDNDLLMQHACRNNEYTLMRALIRCNNHQWVQQYKHSFIDKYYS